MKAPRTLVKFLKGFRVSFISDETALTRMTIYRVLNGAEVCQETIIALERFASAQQVLAGKANVKKATK